MTSKRNVVREVIKERSSYTQDGHNSVSTVNSYSSDTSGNLVNTFHSTHSFDPALTGKVNQLLTERLGRVFLEEAGSKKWVSLHDNKPAGQLLALLSDGYITISYTDHTADSSAVTEFLQSLAGEIDQQLQLP